MSSYALHVRAFDLAAWIEAHRDELRPPVGNARVFDDGDFIVMAVGGPNRRQDFHIDPGAELFFQIEGDMTLRVEEGGVLSDVSIPQGSLFMLPPGVPHSPQRPEGTVGLVVERKRQAGELDGLRWYCDKCREPVHEMFFALVDIATQLRDAIQTWEGDPTLRTCGACGHRSDPG